MRIFVIDDDPTTLDMVTTCLRGSGHEVITYPLALPALDALEQGDEPDAVLTDYCMPSMSGLDLAERCRDRWPSLPIVVMTAMGDYDAAIRGAQIGIVGWLVKPFDLDDLDRVLVRVSPSATAAEKVAAIGMDFRARAVQALSLVTAAAAMALRRG